MQRLTRNNRERGGVAVLVAVLMVPLLALTGVVINIGSMLSEKQQLQNGADAAALAIAQDCAASACGADQNPTAKQYANENLPGAQGTVKSLDQSSGTVTVKTTIEHHNLFASVLQAASQQQMRAEATAAWGAPSGGTAVLPLTFSLDCYSGSTDVPSVTIYFTPNPPEPPCSVPGGFGWLRTDDSNTCNLTTSTGDPVTLNSSPGNAMSQACKDAFKGELGQVVLLPVFDTADGQGSPATYHVYGYAAFVLTGYYFPANPNPLSMKKECSQSDCIKGHFIEFVNPDKAFTYGAGAPNLGAEVVQLTS